MCLLSYFRLGVTDTLGTFKNVTKKSQKKTIYNRLKMDFSSFDLDMALTLNTFDLDLQITLIILAGLSGIKSL